MAREPGFRGGGKWREGDQGQPIDPRAEPPKPERGPQTKRRKFVLDAMKKLHTMGFEGISAAQIIELVALAEGDSKLRDDIYYREAIKQQLEHMLREENNTIEAKEEDDTIYYRLTQGQQEGGGQGSRRRGRRRGR